MKSATGSSHDSNRARDARPFLWGVSTAAHQVEGGNVHSDWWAWEQLPGKIKHGEKSGAACDHWSRFDEDLAIMRSLGVNAYRFSLEWARIEPREGEIDEAAIARYREWGRKLRDAGIEPVLTLHHFTFPQWLRERGGWEWSEAPARFEAYAKLCFERIAPECRIWVTINEPMVHLGGGYVVGVTPPGKKDFASLRAPLVGMLRAHARAYRALHTAAAAISAAPSGAVSEGDARKSAPIQVGMAHHFRIFDPKRAWHPIDRLVARGLSEVFNWTLPRALETGDVRMSIPGLVRIRERLPELRGTQDYLGLNYYTRDLVVLSRRTGKWEPAPSTRAGAPTNDLNWEIYPEGFGRVLREVARRLPGKRIVITENGIADARDDRRGEFIDSHLREVARARANGVPIDGYFHWSLMDNFEWIEGFDPRFGLVEIDYATQARRIRPSADVYRRWIAEGAPKS